MDLVVDDIQYISFPMSCQRDDQHMGGGNSSDNDEETDYINMFNIVVATVRDSAMHRLRTAENWGTRHSYRPSSPGEDPIAAVMGLGNITSGISIPILRRYSHDRVCIPTHRHGLLQGGGKILTSSVPRREIRGLYQQGGNDDG